MPEAAQLPFAHDPVEVLPGDGSALLVPGFIPADEADARLTTLRNGLPWEETSLSMFGREVREPRLSAWHADPGVVYGYSGSNRVVHPWTEDLSALRRRCAEHCGVQFNGVLANVYRDGHDYMGWHADDEPTLGPEPVIASLSFGAERRFDLRHRETGEIVSCTLGHGSLLVMSGLSQACWKHRLPRAARITSARVNLTFRRIVTGR